MDAMTDHDERMSPEQLTAEVRRVMALVGEGSGNDTTDTALVAAWPDPVLQVPEREREQRVTRGSDTMIFDDPEKGRRGFVRALLRVPLDQDKGQAYGVFVELDRDAYQTLQQAFRDKREARVWGRLATRLPLLEDAYMAEVCVTEDGSDKRARVVDARHDTLRFGPKVGP